MAVVALLLVMVVIFAVRQRLTHLLPRDAMLARYSLRCSGHVCVRPSVTHCYCMGETIITDRADFLQGGYIRPILHYILRVFEYLRR